MNINILKNLTISVFTLIFIGFASQAQASAPTLSLVNRGGDSVVVTVNNADPNSSVILDYNGYSGLLGLGIIGYTNNSGYFSKTLNGYSYPELQYGTQVLIVVNYQQSQYVSWPIYSNSNNNNYNNISLSPSNLNLNVGQSANVYISGSYQNQYYISNSTSYVASASISGNTISVYAKNSGSTTFDVCSSNYYSSCATLYVTVQGSTNNYNYPITLSSYNVQLSAGQSSSVSIYNDQSYYNLDSSYYIYSNSNPSIASASINGSVISLYGQIPGNVNIVVCQNDNTSQCVTLFVNVISNNNYQYNQYTDNYQNNPYISYKKTYRHWWQLPWWGRQF